MYFHMKFALFFRFFDSWHIIKYLYLLSFVETPRKFIIAELSIRKLGSSSVLIMQTYKKLINKILID